MSWYLTREQRDYMLDTCELYERSRGIDAGTPQDEGWALIASDVPYYHKQTDNIYQHTAVGEAVQPSILTTDHAIFPQGVPLLGNPGYAPIRFSKKTLLAIDCGVIRA